jgi:hypothetical protein
MPLTAEANTQDENAENFIIKIEFAPLARSRKLPCDVDRFGGFVFFAVAGDVFFVAQDTRGTRAQSVCLAPGNVALAKLFGRHVGCSVVAVLFQLNAAVYGVRARFSNFLFVDGLGFGVD